MSYAYLTEYLPFDKPVPWTINGRYAEEHLRSLPRAEVGRSLRGKSVRPLSDSDFADLIALGLKETLDLKNAERLGVSTTVLSDAAEAVIPDPAGERNWRVESILTNRVIREASFRRAVYEAYDNRCAATGLRIIDGKGKSEVQAAHIWPVSERGPDVIQNGIALTATVHWLFDRHLISITDDYRVLIAEIRVPVEIRALLLRNDGKIHLPPKSTDWPHPTYLSRHRDIFKSVNGIES
jgi:putative restriction endonuclease